MNNFQFSYLAILLLSLLFLIQSHEVILAKDNYRVEKKKKPIQKYIKGTKILYTKNNHDVFLALMTYQQALKLSRFDKLVEMLSPNFHEDRGTKAKSDDYGYKEVKRKLLWMKRMKVKVVEFHIDVKKLHFQSPTTVDVFVNKKFVFQFRIRKGITRNHKGTLDLVMKLEKKSSNWLFVKW